MHKEKTQNMLQKMNGKRILVVGDLVLDHYLEGIVTRVSPEAPVPVVELFDNSDRMMAGGAANVALNVLSMGGKPFVAGVVGDDQAGLDLLLVLNKAGIDTTMVLVDNDRPTTVKTRVVSKTQQLLRIDREKTHNLSLSIEEKLISLITKQEKLDGFILEDYDKGVFSTTFISFLIENAKNRLVRLSVDPKIRNFWSYNNCNLFKPNRHEAGKALGFAIDSVEKAIYAGEKIQKQLSCEAVLLTLGSKGSVLVYKNAGGIEHKFLPTLAQHVFDVSGAGDSVIAIMGLARCSDISLTIAAELANLAAAVVCSEPGVHAVKPEEILDRCI